MNIAESDGERNGIKYASGARDIFRRGVFAGVQLASATQVVEGLTQELAALEVACRAAGERLVIVQTARQVAVQRNQSAERAMTGWRLRVLALCLVATGQAAAQDLPVLGRVVPLQEAVISAPRSGHLVELRVEVADRIMAGELIARFSCQIEQAQHEAALAASRSLELQYRSQEQLREFASTSVLEVEIALAEWQRSLAEAEIHASVTAQCSLVAPFDGVISTTAVRNFEYVGAGQGIVRIIDQSQKFFEFLAPLSWLSERTIGDRIDLYFEAIDREVSATIDRIAPDVDAVSQTVRMRAIIEDATNANAIPVGMPGMVRRENNSQAR